MAHRPQQRHRLPIRESSLRHFDLQGDQEYVLPSSSDSLDNSIFCSCGDGSLRRLFFSDKEYQLESAIATKPHYLSCNQVRSHSACDSLGPLRLQHRRYSPPYRCWWRSEDLRLLRYRQHQVRPAASRQAEEQAELLCFRRLPEPPNNHRRHYCKVHLEYPWHCLTVCFLFVVSVSFVFCSTKRCRVCRKVQTQGRPA